MEAKVKVKGVDMGGVGSKVAKLKTDRDLGIFAASEAARLMDQYVPARSGALYESAYVNEQPWVVSYTMPYAIYVWNGRGMKFSKQKHPNARSHWSRPLENDPSPLAAKITQKLESM